MASQSADDVNDLVKLLDSSLGGFKKHTTTDDELDEIMAVHDRQAIMKAWDRFQDNHLAGFANMAQAANFDVDAMEQALLDELRNVIGGNKYAEALSAAIEDAKRQLASGALSAEQAQEVQQQLGTLTENLNEIETFKTLQEPQQTEFLKNYLNRLASEDDQQGLPRSFANIFGI